MGAPTVASVEATAQAQQSALVSLLGDPLKRAWALLDPNDPSTIEDFIKAIAALTQQFSRVSANEAAKYYAKMRIASGIPGSIAVKHAPLPPMAQIDASTRWATREIWKPNPDLQAVQSTVQGVVERNVLDTGRMTIINAVQSDRKAKGWARETEPGCCSFCAMLAVRGAVYRSEDSASFESHNNCRCFAVPVFNAYEPSAQVREWQQLYKESTRGVRGGKKMRKAFRNAYEAKYPTK
jgi:hypothetical protein